MVSAMDSSHCAPPTVDFVCHVSFWIGRHADGVFDLDLESIALLRNCVPKWVSICLVPRRTTKRGQTETGSRFLLDSACPEWPCCGV